MRHKQFIPAVLVGVALLAGGCGSNGGFGEATSKAAKVEEIPGSHLSRVILTARAAQRLDVQTARVRRLGANRTVIPYSAVLYDPNGNTWTYTSPKHLVFIRHDITVDRIEGKRAILSAGPRVGTAVVTVGATELWGVEYGGIEED